MSDITLTARERALIRNEFMVRFATGERHPGEAVGHRVEQESAKAGNGHSGDAGVAG
ncbi:hypothetical protein VH569_12860 [Azospirillum sp. 11R-A]|uniref:hypothetical protein n=1 Tax=Azospirillum sp. 11R-A TaxID=3111634 RepID=UPI003C23FAA4